MVLAEGHERAGQQSGDRAREGADAQRPGQVGPRGGECGVGLLERGEHGLRVPDQDRAGRRERDAAAGAGQEGDAGFPFERGQLLRDGRRRVGVRLRHGGDRAELSEVAQEAQAADVEHKFSLRDSAVT
jgi:hypothetical protein